MRLELSRGALPVSADRVLLEQVVLNLGLNALQAMQGLNKGANDALGPSDPTTPETPAAAIAAAGGKASELLLRTAAETKFARLQVIDRGPGLPPEIAERLFEPFFTTRADGLGLGLNICRSIVESMGGELLARNRDDGVTGAIFEIRLPCLPTLP